MLSAKRVVIDSNIWISSLVFGGNSRVAIQLLIKEGYALVVSEEILTEVRRILHQKFDSFTQDFEDLLVAMRPRLLITRLGKVLIDVCRDPADNIILETAVLGKASHIISSDKDLLVLEKFQAIAILSPREFLTISHD